MISSLAPTAVTYCAEIFKTTTEGADSQGARCDLPCLRSGALESPGSWISGHRRVANKAWNGLLSQVKVL